MQMVVSLYVSRDSLQLPFDPPTLRGVDGPRPCMLLFTWPLHCCIFPALAKEGDEALIDSLAISHSRHFDMSCCERCDYYH